MMLVRGKNGRKQPRLLFIGDAACATGFARVTHALLDRLCVSWDVHVLGINYHGDPHRFPYPIYPAALGGDALGVGRYANLVQQLDPDMVLILHDPWVIQAFLDHKGPEPMVAYVPIDAQNIAAAPALKALNHVVFYTEFGEAQCRFSGYEGPATVIPHGIDMQLFCPIPQADARAALGWGEALPEDAFVFGNINSNQPRKRIDLTLLAFAAFVREWEAGGEGQRPPYLLLHMPPRAPYGYDLIQLGQALGVGHRIVFPHACESGDERRGGDSFGPVPDVCLPLIYNALDVQMSTSTGEGFGLTTMEGMACGIPQILPRHSALAEWAAGVALFVDCAGYWTTPNGVNTIGRVIDEGKLLQAMGALYRAPDARAELRQAGLGRVQQPCFAWDVIADRFDRLLQQVLEAATPPGDMDLARIEPEEWEALHAAPA